MISDLASAIGESLCNLTGAISVRCIEGRVRFDRPAPVRHLATATLRGLAGHALAATAPEMVCKHFKPRAGNERPAAYLFQPLHDLAGMADAFPFRIVTWDREGEFLPAMKRALGLVAGWPFGESGARIEAIVCGPEEELKFSGSDHAGSRMKILLHSPVRIPVSGGWAGENNLALGHLVKASVSRLNILSQNYGGGQTLDPLPYLTEASFAREVRRELAWVSPRRRSSTQNINLCLSGIVGTVEYSGVTKLVTDLLLSASLFHIGRHTVEGCGHIVLSS